MRLDLYMNTGINSNAIFKALNLKEEKIPRLRGVGIEDGLILIHTRTGGGNRESYGTSESYVYGDYGIDDSIKEAMSALNNYEDYRWTTKAYNEADYKNSWEIPYEAMYRFPETDKEWYSKEEEIRKTIQELENQAKEVHETKAYTNEYMKSNKYYIRDEDDDFDSTYANFWFEVPEDFRNELLKLEDPVMKAAFGDAEDYIKGMIGGDQEAKDRIQKRIDEAAELEKQKS